MESKQEIKKLKKRIDQKLQKFFQIEIKKASAIDQTFKKATKMVADFTLRGGKRVRAALMYYGYLATNKKDISAILDASLSMELAHSFLLIHDDIIDNDELRRGHPTLHKQYEKLLWQLKVKEPRNIGRSLAMLCGDIAYTLANQILCQSKFPNPLKIKAIHHFQQMVNHTAAGEVMDVISQTSPRITPEQATKIYKLKTAEYTIEGPLLIGSILGDADQKLQKTLSQYAIYLGVAFQINDDLLGIFGNPKETGKDIGSDLQEGKKTILLLKTLEKASPKEKKFIQALLRKQKITKQDIKSFQKLATESGALAHCESLANNLSLKAKEIILKSKISRPSRDFLLENANYIIERKK